MTKSTTRTETPSPARATADPAQKGAGKVVEKKFSPLTEPIDELAGHTAAPPPPTAAAVQQFPRAFAAGGAKARARLVQRLQQQVGNRRLGQMFEQRLAGPRSSDGPQTKIAVGEVGDSYEKEADQIAGQVVSGRNLTDDSSRTAPGMPTSLDEKTSHRDHHPPLSANTDPGVQRLCKACREESASPEKEKKEGMGMLRAKPLGSSPMRVTTGVQRTLDSPGAGSPVPEHVREKVEPVLGKDLGDVQVHSDDKAQEAAEQLNAKAFTHRKDIYLGRGQRAGDTALMAHELTHTAQQCDAEGGDSGSDSAARALPLQRTPDCETAAEEGGSEDEAQQAESTPPASGCTETNRPVEQPPEGARESEEEEAPASPVASAGEPDIEAPASIKAHAGASVRERQSHATPADKNAPPSEEDLSAASGAESEARPQDPCTVRERAGAQAGGTAAGANERKPAPTSAQGNAPSQRASAEGGAQTQRAATESGAQTQQASPEGGAQTQRAAAKSKAPEGEEQNSFLIKAIRDTSVGVPSTGRGEAASPDLAAERDAMSASTEENLAALNATLTTVSSTTAGGLSFAPPPSGDNTAQTDSDRGAPDNFSTANTLVNTFMGRAGQRLKDFITQGLAATGAQRTETRARKAALRRQIQQRLAATRGTMAQWRADARERAQTAIESVEAQHRHILGMIDARAVEFLTQIETVYQAQSLALQQARDDQSARLGEVYQTGYDTLIGIGREKGDQATQRAGEHERAYRNADHAPPDIQRRVRQREKDGYWDGYLSYNRYMARADAAQEVGGQYRDGFQAEARAQADNMLCGQAKDAELVNQIGEQGLESLTCARDNAIDSIENQRVSAIEMAERARKKSLDTIETGLRATEAQLSEREAGQRQLLEDYGARQHMAIERDCERAAGAILQGVNDAAMRLLRYLDQFGAGIAATQAPEAGELAARLVAEEAQLTASLDGAQAALHQAIAQTRTALDGGRQQAATALDQLYQQGIDGASALAEGFRQATADLASGAQRGYEQILAAYEERLAGEWENTTHILEGVVNGVTGIFTQINDGIEGRFHESAEQMRQGMQNTLDTDLDQKICAEAEKAAADVQPWWKGVLKVLLIIVVIVVVALVLGPAIIGAVGAAAAALAGSLGAGAALAGTIGAWIGPIIGGAIVGAIAGAAIQLGSNALYNRPLTEGLQGAVIAGAIGGALGGVGGQLGQLLVGRFATTAFSRIAIQFGSDAAFDVLGGILGDLAAGNPITWESVVMGLAIGGAVQISMGGIGGLARARTAGVPPEVLTGRLASGRLGRAAERITDLQGRAMAAGERLGARAGAMGPNAPTTAATREALAGARARMEEGEALPTRGGAKPEGWRGRPAAERPGRIETDGKAAPPTRQTSDSNDINDPRVQQEIDDLGPMTPETRRLLAENPKLRRTLLENPAAARALKKCASPCFPENMDPEDVSRLNGLLKEHPDIDSSRLSDYLHQHKADPERLSKAINRLMGSSDPRAFIDDVATGKIDETVAGVETRTEVPNNIRPNFDPNRIRENAAIFKQYVREIEEFSNYKLGNDQKELLKEFLRQPDNGLRKLSPQETKAHRWPQTTREDLIKQWEQNTGQQWPKYTHDKVSKRGNVYIRKGEYFDAHEIIPNQYNAPHEWWNIVPAERPNAHQGGIHGSGSGYGKIVEKF